MAVSQAALAPQPRTTGVPTPSVPPKSFSGS